MCVYFLRFSLVAALIRRLLKRRQGLMSNMDETVFAVHLFLFGLFENRLGFTMFYIILHLRAERRGPFFFLLEIFRLRTYRCIQS